MRYLIMILILGAVGCGRRPSEVDPELWPYFSRFEIETGISVAGITGMFEVSEGTTIAYCLSAAGSELGTIKVDRDKWIAYSENGKEEIIYHELGHCVLDLDHTQERLSDGCPASVMSPFAFGNTACYAIHKAEYIARLREHR